MEFKVFHEIFCVHHHIKRFSIAFDVYVERVFERYLVSTISIEPMDWAIICVGALMNWGRKDLNTEYSDCGSMDEVNCWEKNDLIIFTLAGCFFRSAVTIHFIFKPIRIFQEHVFSASHYF